MEAVPKLPLIHFQLKTSPASTEFSHKLKEYIRRFYNEDPEAYNKEIKDLETLRQAACNVQRDFTGCSTLKKYYAQLQLLQSRFPMSEDGAASVTFMWLDNYSGSSSAVTDIKIEQACILHNIGALHSELGALDNRQTSEGMKISCTHFQCAAWAFQHLRDNYPQPRGTDMSHDVLTLYINVMLGQAQECILEKSMLDNRKCTIVAKIAAQIIDYYNLALKILDKSSDGGHVATTVGSKIEKSWRKYFEFKIAYHGCVMYLYLGSQAEELQKMGERVAYYQMALDKLNEASKLAKTLEQDLSDAMSFTMDIVGGKLNAASKENEFVYHEKVPSADGLPEVKGASLVKGIPFDPADPEILGHDIFVRLVPMEAHEASSLYSEEKAKILRKTSAMIEERDHELMSYLSSLQLEQLKLMPESDRLPQELVDCCAAISVKPNAVKDLVLAMQNLSGMFHDVESVLQEIDSLLEEENRQEKECVESIGKRPPSMILLEMKEELKKYREAHKKASESNMTLHKAMDHHIGNLNLLSAPLDELMKNIPSLAIMDAPNDEGMKQELRRLLTKVDEMKSQRQMLLGQLREQILSDDITKQLVTREDQNIQEVFDFELKKHDALVALIRQNLAAQENILKALTDVNARYADTRRITSEVMQRRRATIAALIASYDAYEELISKSQKGYEFYRKLEASATKLLKRVRSVCHVQEEEREKILESQAKKANVKSAQQTKYPPTIPDTGPKLKDYLKYMTPSGSTVPHLSSIVREVSLPNSAIAADASYGGSMVAIRNLPSSNQVVAEQLDTVSPRIGGGYPESELSYPTSGMPSAFRPAPVGSEHTDTLPSVCSGIQSTQTDTQGFHKGYQGYGQNVFASYGQAYSVPSSAEVPAAQTFLHQNVPSGYDGYSQFQPPQSYGNILPPSLTYDCSAMNGQQCQNGFNPQQQQASWYPSTAANTVASTGLSQYDNRHFSTNPTYISYNGMVPDYAAATAAAANVVTSNYSSPGQPSGTDATLMAAAVALPPNTSSLINKQQQPPYCDVPPQVYPINQSQHYQQTSVVPGHAVSQQQQQQPIYSGTTYASNDMYYQPSPAVAHFNPILQQTQQQPIPSSVPSSAYTLPPATANINNNNNVSTAEPQKLDSNLTLLQQLDFSITPSLPPVTSDAGLATDSKPPSEPKNKDLLSETRTSSDTVAPVLKPKVLTVEDIVMQKEQREREARCHAAMRDPFSDRATLERFVAEVEHFQKVVEGLCKQSLNGPTPLEQKWKELSEAQDRFSRRTSISVARCYSLKNRVPDVMPYDCSRVEISLLKDDYINASHITNLSKNTANYIATQAPLLGTMRDFWTMVFEQQAEVVAVLVNDAELKGDIYWPPEKNQDVDFGGVVQVRLQSYKTKPWGAERIISITHLETRISRVVVHLQFSSWPPGGMPTSPSLFLHFVNEVQTFHRDQRSLSRPVVVHCSAGAGRTGVFCLVSTAIHEILAGSGIIDLWDLALKLVQMRKYVLQDKEHMKFCLQAVLYFAEDVLLKRGILIKRASFDDKVPSASSRKSSHTRNPSQDFVLPASHDEKPTADPGTDKSSDAMVSVTTASPTKLSKEEPTTVSSEPGLSRSNSSASVASVASVSSNASSLALPPHASPQHLPTPGRAAVASPAYTLPNSLANLDAAHFTLEPMPRRSKKITKESFLNAGSGGLLAAENGDPNDPLSQLDPLWSLHN